MKGKTAARTTDKLVNTGIDILPTILESAGIDIPSKLPGLSLWPIVMGNSVPKWRDYIVVENDMRAWEVADTPRIEGRMILTGRYKYCIYSKGALRESLVDLERDPGENVNLAIDPAYKKVILKHKELLKGFCMRYNDLTGIKILSSDAELIPLTETLNTNTARHLIKSKVNEY
jgi:arylsulfatase A-like enzyme